MVSRRLGIGPRTPGRGFACACLLIAVGIAGPVRAEGNDAASARANLLFIKGKAAYNSGKFADALRIYKEAWSLRQSPDIAANLAQAEAESGQHRDAAEHYSFALAHLLPSTTDEQRQALADGLAKAKTEIGALHVTLEPEDSSLTIDDTPVSVPANGDIFVEPGAHAVSVSHDGYETNRQTLRLSQGSSQVLWIKLQEVGANPEPASRPSGDASAERQEIPPPPADHSRHSLVPALVGGGLVVAGGAVGVVFLLTGNAAQKDADEIRSALPEVNACGTGTPHATECAVLHDKNSDIDRARTVEIIGFGVAGAAAVGTALYLLWPRSHAHTVSYTHTLSHTFSPSDFTSHWSPTFAIAPGAASFGLGGRF